MVGYPWLTHVYRHFHEIWYILQAQCIKGNSIPFMVPVWQSSWQCGGGRFKMWWVCSNVSNRGCVVALVIVTMCQFGGVKKTIEREKRPCIVGRWTKIVIYIKSTLGNTRREYLSWIIPKCGRKISRNPLVVTNDLRTTLIFTDGYPKYLSYF